MVLDKDKRYAEEDYFNLVKKLIVAPNIDEELQFACDFVVRQNPRFFVSMLQKVSAIRKEAASSNESKLMPALDIFEAKLNDYTNVILADLPDSILIDKELTGHFLADLQTIHFQQEDWYKFQLYIIEKANTIPGSLELTFLNWCKKMLEMNYGRHKSICKQPMVCGVNLGYDRRIQYIARLLEDATPLQIEHTPILPNQPLQDSRLILSNRKGAKIDLIRVLNALWELGFFKDQDNRNASKLSVMKTIGNVLSIDLAEYDKDLSQAFLTLNIELNTKIFKELEEITKNKLLEK